MPSPVYIICSNSGTEDNSSKLLSHFDVIERITFSRPEGEADLRSNLPQLRLRIVAVWRIDEDDPVVDEYETTLRFVMLPEGLEQSLGVQTIRVRTNSKLLRIVMRYDGPVPFTGTGLLRVQNQIRAVGANEWLIQEYPIFVDEQQTAPSSSEDDAVSEAAPD